MKTMKSLWIVLFLGFVGVQFSFAQSGPALTTKLTNEQIEQKVQAHIAAFARDVQPTAALSDQFRKDFPQASDVEWEVAADVYEVDFEVGRIDYKAYYDASTNLLAYKKDIRSKNLPAAVKKSVEAEYPGYRLDDTEEVKSGTATYYKIELERGETEVKLVLDAAGKKVNLIFD